FQRLASGYPWSQAGEKANFRAFEVFSISLKIGEDFAVVQQEIIMMKDCKHPNIVAYFGSYLRYIVCFPYDEQ
ncbi:hypothetical protein FD755_006973, partial [Muntiacus reevesi]